MRKSLSLWISALAAWTGACAESPAQVEQTGVPADPPPVTVPSSVVILEFVAGDGQILTAGETAPEAFVVEARDSGGALLTGIPITMRATVEGGLFLPLETQSTDGEGRVSYNFQAPPTALLLGVQASAPGAETVFVSVESHAGPAVSLDVQVDPTAISIGSTATVDVVSLDRFGNVAELSGLELTIGGSAAFLAGRTIHAVEPGEGTILARLGTVRDSAYFAVFGSGCEIAAPISACLRAGSSRAGTSGPGTPRGHR